MQALSSTMSRKTASRPRAATKVWFGCESESTAAPYASVATSEARLRSWTPSALLIGPETTAAASVDSCTSAVSVTRDAWSPSGSISKTVVPLRLPSTRSSTSRRGGSCSTIRTVIGSCTPTLTSSQAMSPFSSTRPFRTSSGSMRRCLCGSAIHSHTTSGGAGQVPVTETRMARSGGVVADGPVERVPLAGPVARVSDRVDEVLGGGAVGSAGRRDDVLLDHDRAHVVGPERERDLADLHALRHPRRLDVLDVVEVDPAHSLHQQVVEARRRPGHLRGKRGVVGLVRPRDERAEAVHLVLQLADAAHVLDPLLERLDVAPHHRGRGAHAEPVGGAHDLQPLVGGRLLRRDDLAHAVDQDLGAAAGERVEAGVAQPSPRLRRRQPGLA